MCAQREGRISSARGVRVWPSSGVGAEEAQTEAHLEHVAHVYDAGGVKAQRLVESIRTLPSPKAGIRQRDDACGTEMWHRGKGKSAAHAACVCGPAREWGQERRRRKRTENMRLMSVTLEVSKLSGWLKADAYCRVQRGHPTLRETRVARRCGTEGRANQQRTRRACVAQLGSGGRRGADGSAPGTCSSCL